MNRQFAIADLLDTPYRFGGRTVGPPPDGGLDCIGLAAEVCRRMGIAFPMPRAYGDGRIDPASYVEWHRHWIADTARPGSVCCMASDDGLHIGVCIAGRGDGAPARNHSNAEPRIIHAARETGVVVHRLSRLEARITGWYRAINDGRGAVCA